MKKIPTIFLRDERDRRYVTDIANIECEWVFAGEGVATRKYDGTCVMFDGEKWWARREVKPGKDAPDNWVEADHDEVTGKRMGWEPIEQSSFAKFHAEALDYGWAGVPGTYELIGPKIQGNPEGAAMHMLVSHEHAEPIIWLDRSYAGLLDLTDDLRELGIEGIVWHHPDGRMAKLKVKDMRRG